MDHCFIFIDRDVTLNDGPVGIYMSRPLVETNVNPDKDFLVAASDYYDNIPWKIFSTP